MEPRYNDPNLTAEQFLYEVMRDPKVDIHDRVRAAAALMESGPPKPTLTIQIGGLLEPEETQMWVEWMAFQREQMAYYKTLPKHEQKEIRDAIHRLERCNQLNVGDVKFMSVKGHG